MAENGEDETSEFWAGIGFRLIGWAVLTVLLASLFPGYPTIEPTDDCSLQEAQRCLELNDM